MNRCIPAEIKRNGFLRYVLYRSVFRRFPFHLEFSEIAGEEDNPVRGQGLPDQIQQLFLIILDGKLRLSGFAVGKSRRIQKDDIKTLPVFL